MNLQIQEIVCTGEFLGYADIMACANVWREKDIPLEII
jgi:hypothetical protein